MHGYVDSIDRSIDALMKVIVFYQVGTFLSQSTQSFFYVDVFAYSAGMASYKASTLVLLVIFSCVVASYAAVSKRHLRGGWHPIKDVNVPEIQELAKFALRKHNKVNGATLQFAKVLSGEQQVVSGVRYNLIMAAKGANGKVEKYEAVVWDKPLENSRKLIFFDIVSNDPLCGGWNPIEDVNASLIQEAAKFALREHNKVHDATLQFVKVLSGEEQVVAGANYKLILAANGANGKPEKYEAVVYEKLWKDFRKLKSFRRV